MFPNPTRLTHPLTQIVTTQVLKVGGLLWIAEVRSRFDGKDGVASVDGFVKTLTSVSYTHLRAHET